MMVPSIGESDARRNVLLKPQDSAKKGRLAPAHGGGDRSPRQIRVLSVAVAAFQVEDALRQGVEEEAEADGADNDADFG